MFDATIETQEDPRQPSEGKQNVLHVWNDSNTKAWTHF